MAKDEQKPAAQKRRPTIDVLERRAQGVGLHGTGAPAIELKDPGWNVRWFNAAIRSDRIWQAKHQQGWEPVTPDELADPDQVGGFSKSVEGFVVRGDRGQEVLMKMPTDYRTQIERAKAAENIRNMNPHRQKEQVIEAAGKNLGDQAASYMDAKMKVIGNVTTTKERIAVSPDVS